MDKLKGMARRGQAPTQTEKAYTALKRAILQGEIREGVFLSESEILERYKIGRTPYREACNRLIHEGLLETMPRRGYFVPELPFHAVCDVFETRLVLEGSIAELAAARAEDAEIDELERLANKPLNRKESKTDFAGLIQANTEFHLHLASMTRNRELVEILARNLEKAERLMYIELRSSRYREQDSQTLHMRIVNALRTRKPDAVRQAVLDDVVDGQSTALKFGREVLGLRLGSEKEVPPREFDGVAANTAHTVQRVKNPVTLGCTTLPDQGSR